MGFLLLCTIGVTETTAKAPFWVTLFSVIFTVDLTASLILESSSSLSNLKRLAKRHCFDLQIRVFLSAIFRGMLERKECRKNVFSGRPI